MSLNIYDKDLKQKILVDGTDEVDSALSATSTNPVQNRVVTSVIDDMNNVLGAKNILPFDLADIKALNTDGTWAGNVYTYRGVDFTVNSDGTISATGTATGGNSSIKIFAASSNYEMLGKEVILNGCPSGGGASTYRIQAYRMTSVDGSDGTIFDNGTGSKAFTVLNNASGTVGSFAVAIYENATVTNLLFKPMARLASISDDTYAPYSRTNQELTGEVEPMLNVLGAKNLLPSNIVTQTVSGVTFTVNSDGTVRANGTATSVIQISLSSNFSLKKGAYILSGCSIGGGQQTYELRLIKVGTPSVQIATDWGIGSAIIYVDEDITANVNLVIRSGVTVSNLVFRPMLRPASIEDSTYVPYAKTNRELTNQVNVNKNNISTLTQKENSRGSIYYYEMGSQSESFTANAPKTYEMPTTLPVGKYIISASIVFESVNGSRNINDMLFTTTNNEGGTQQRRFYNGQGTSGAIPTTSFTETWNMTVANSKMSLIVTPLFTASAFFICGIKVMRIA